MSSSKINGGQAEIAYLAGGPFWCLEAIFRRLPGVISVTSGFSGGDMENPTYYEVCNGKTGHSEVIRVEFDSLKISYQRLLDVFWQAHNPTCLNTTFEVGTQYRSMILCLDEEQKRTATLSKAQAQNYFMQPVITGIVPFKKFYKAEIRHQGYYDSNIEAPYCQIIIAPRLQALENKGMLPKKSDTEFLNKHRAA